MPSVVNHTSLVIFLTFVLPSYNPRLTVWMFGAGGGDVFEGGGGCLLRGVGE